MTKKKILIIDDDNDFIVSTKVVLEAKNHEVFSASDIKEGFSKVEEIMPDLIIMDVMMDKMSDGFDLSRKIKSDDKYKKIPILIVTAIADKTGFHFSESGGDKAWLPVDDYMEKPILSNELVSKVEKLLCKNLL